MKRMAIFSFSQRGAILAQRISEGLCGEWEVELCAPHGDLAAETAVHFTIVDALIFVGACGIAVRAVGPLARSKQSDPAVVVVDELGRHVISLLGGHISGANALARRVAEIVGGEAVITTATDINGRFSVDDWAARNGLAISDMALAKRFSSEILRRDLPLWTDLPVEGALPAGIILVESESEAALAEEASVPGTSASPMTGRELGVAVTFRRVQPFVHTLRLVPRILYVGIGCRRCAGEDAIASAVDAALKDAGLDSTAVAAIASIDIKLDEAGLIAYSRAMGLPFMCFSAERLNAAAGEFTASRFVLETAGVDNVCERAAMCAAGANASLLLPKRVTPGVTVAVASADWRVRFE